MVSATVYIDKKLRDMAQKYGINVSQTCNTAIKTMVELYAAEGNLKEMEENTAIKLQLIREERYVKGNVMINGLINNKSHKKKLKSRKELLEKWHVIKRKRSLTAANKIYWVKTLGVSKEEVMEL